MRVALERELRVGLMQDGRHFTIELNAHTVTIAVTVGRSADLRCSARLRRRLKLECRGRGPDPHDPFGPRDFESEIERRAGSDMVGSPRIRSNNVRAVCDRDGPSCVQSFTLASPGCSERTRQAPHTPIRNLPDQVIERERPPLGRRDSIKQVVPSEPPSRLDPMIARRPIHSYLVTKSCLYIMETQRQLR